MIEQLKDRLSALPSVGSVELQIESNGSITVHWLILSKKKQVLEIEKSGTFKGELNQLSEFIPVSLPLVLSLSGKGVLHKKVQQSAESKDKLFDYVFPNARISEYVVQYQASNENTFYVSVARKDQVERILEQLTELGYIPLSLSLGAFAVVPLLKAIQFQEMSITGGRHVLKTDHGAIKEYAYTTEEVGAEITIADQKMPSVLFVSYAMAFQYLVNGLEKVEVTFDTFDSLRQSYREKKVFKALAVGGLAFFFGLLAINTIAYSLLTETNNRLSAAYGSVQHLTVSNKKDAEDFERKETFLTQAGWLHPAAISYYSDRIASSLPEEIQLTSLSVYPFNEQVSRKGKKEVFDPDLILVKGISKRPTDINRWVKELNDYSWINQIKIQDYSFDHKSGTGNFSLHILISGELE